MESTNSKKFYVYSLAYQGEVFYIGKGTGKRIDSHEKEAKKGTISSKCETIRRIWAEEGKVEKEILLETDFEEQAFALEAKLIRCLGVENLTNAKSGNEFLVPIPLIDREGNLRVVKKPESELSSDELKMLILRYEIKVAEYEQKVKWYQELLKEK